MATLPEQELAPLTAQQEAATVIAVKAQQPAPKPKLRKEKPEVLFKWKLKENDGCCSSWCSAHFFLIYLLLENIANIVIAAYHLKVLTDPYGTHEICYYPTNDDGSKECVDEREFYESAGLTVGFLGCEIAFLCIYVILVIMTFHALQKCIPWIFMALWIAINVQIIFILVHTVFTGIYWGIFALLIPMMLSCYFWMLYQLAKYFQKGGIYDQDMRYYSPAPNNYAVLYVAKPEDLAHYHAHYRSRNEKPLNSKQLFHAKMNQAFDFCCCQCTLQTWSIIWLIYMLFQNALWFSSSVVTTVILYDPYGTWMDCVEYGGEGEPVKVDCRVWFENNGLTKAFSIIACIVAGFAIIVNVWCWRGLYTVDKNAFMTQVLMLLIQGFFMLLYSIFTGYYFGLFALLIPLLLSCHFYDVYIVCVYCQQGINTQRIPKMQAVIVHETEQPSGNGGGVQSKVIYVPAPQQQPVRFVNETGQDVYAPDIDAVPQAGAAAQ